MIGKLHKILRLAAKIPAKPVIYKYGVIFSFYIMDLYSGLPNLAIIRGSLLLWPLFLTASPPMHINHLLHHFRLQQGKLFPCPLVKKVVCK